MPIKSSLIILFLFLAAGFLAAQEEFVIYEGAQLNYNVGFHEGNSYTWEVFTGLNPSTRAGPSEVLFFTDVGFSEVGVQWNIAGQYFLLATETNVLGCSTSRMLAVQVVPNNRSIGFGLTASTECFNLEGNSFEQAVEVIDNNGPPLPKSYFPLTVNFTVNEVEHVQQLEFGNTLLQINDDWFTAYPEQNNEVVVRIIQVTDKYNAPIQPGGENSMHVRTIFAIPAIEFTEELRRLYYQNKKTRANINNSTAYRMEWMQSKQNFSEDNLMKEECRTRNFEF